MVLTLIIVCDESEYEMALEASMEAGREHPSRILLVVTAAAGPRRLSAEVQIGEGTPGEVVVIRMRGPVAAHPASVIRPLLLAGLPGGDLVAGQGAAPTGARRAGSAGHAAADRCRGVPARPLLALRARALDYIPGDTDLSWTRLTPWRALLAAALDQYPAKIKAVVVEAERNNPSADLLAAWLQSGCKVEVTRKVSDGPGITASG